MEQAELDAPTVDDMISESVESATPTDASTTLEDVVLRFEEETTDDDANDSDVIINDNDDDDLVVNRRKRSTTRRTAKAPTKKKAELVAEVERLQSEVAAMRARNDENAVKQLATSIEMASYLAFGYAGEVRGPHWALTEKEAHDIGETGAVAMAPYAAQLGAKLPWVVFAGVLGKAVYERAKIDRAIAAQLQSGKTNA